MKPDFEEIWKRIVENKGEIFKQIRGGKFTYKIEGGQLNLSRTNHFLPKKHLKEAYKLVPLRKTTQVQHLRAPSYIFAILMDRRIRKSDW